MSENEKQNPDSFGDVSLNDLTTIVAKGDNWFVAHCLELGVVSQGKTETEARQNLKEAVKFYLDTAQDQQRDDRGNRQY